MHVGMSSEQRESNKGDQYAPSQRIRSTMKTLDVTDLRLASLHLLQWYSLIIIQQILKYQC